MVDKSCEEQALGDCLFYFEVVGDWKELVEVLLYREWFFVCVLRGRVNFLGFYF